MTLTCGSAAVAELHLGGERPLSDTFDHRAEEVGRWTSLLSLHNKYFMSYVMRNFSPTSTQKAGKY